MPTTPSSKYRPEIDGLRAFAVIAVIINHFNKDLLPSGYLGVDIFFVISGYVITASLADRQSKNFLDFVTGFYERRIKRLVPALVVFVLITSVLICLFNPDPGVALSLGWRSLFGISNINLYRSSTDYFAQSTELNPFTHTWSLGVEEQFYLLFPLLIWFSGFGQQKAKGARNLFFWVGALTIASLIGFIYLYQVNQPAAYFLMPPRFWEMAAGCLLFIGFQKRARIEQVLEQVPPLLVVAAMVGVMFLPVSAAVPTTVGIVVLSAILIACLKQGTAAYKLLTLEKVAFVGLISYSLYLWHWTVLCISRWTIGVHWWSAPFQIGLMLLMATGSYKWIERPTRKSVSSGRFWTLSGGLICLALSGFAVKKGLASLKESLYRGDRYEYYMSSNPAYSGKLPFQESKTPNSRNLVVLGNSHAGHLLPLVEEVADRFSWAYKVYATPSKPIPAINGNWFKVVNASEIPPNHETPLATRKIQTTVKKVPIMNIGDEAVRAIRALRRGDVLVLSSRHFPMYQRLFVHNGSSYYLDARDDINQLLDKRTLSAIWRSKLQEIIRQATEKGADVVFFAPLPEFQSELEDSPLCSKEWFRISGGTLSHCRLLEPREPMLRKRFFPEMEATLVEMKRQFPGFHLFDPFPAMCPPSKKFCASEDNSGRLYSDNDHLSVRGALLLAKVFEDFLERHSLSGI